MRDYGKVFTTFWTSETTQPMSDNAKVLALYLLSSPHTNMLGCFRLPDAYIAEDLKRDITTVAEGFQELLQQGFANRDPGSKWVFVHRFLEWNKVENPNQGVSVIKLFHQVPDSFACKRALAETLHKAIGHFSEKIKPEIWHEFETVCLTLSPTVSKPGTGTGTGTGTEAGAGSETGAGNFAPGSQKPAAAGAAAAKKKKAPDADKVSAFQEVCRQIWQAYATAYQQRYRVDPVRNAKVSTQVNAFAKRLAADDAPLVAAWFVSHPNAYYVGKGHDFGALLADCEKLRTEWATGQVMTGGKARQADRTGTNAAALAEVLAGLDEGMPA